MLATVVLNKGREKSLLRHHPWIFASAIKSHSGKLRSGDSVDVVSSDNRWLARGAWSPTSTIKVRVWTFDEEEAVDNAFFLRRIETALQGRLKVQANTSAYRIVAGESDGLPGVTIDRYNDVLVCQLLSAGAEKHRDKIVWALEKLLPECAIHERSDVQVREKEGLPLLAQTIKGEVPDELIIKENNVQLLVDIKQGHKTGFYLDQRRNRATIANYASNKTVLNCFSYSGAMSVYCLAAGASHVTNLDQSDTALALAARNIELNNPGKDNYTQLNVDVFAQLRAYRAEGKQFDLIILDPPKFVDNRHHLTKACRGYKDINLLAMQLLTPNGILATFSCSGLMPEDLFHKVVADAALDAERKVQYLERLSQAEDHPVASTYPEGYYLKGLICRVL